MNFCQHRNNSIRRQIYHKSGNSSYSLKAAWDDIVSTCYANSTCVDNETITTFGSTNHAGNYPYCGLILTPGGYMYGIPYGSNQIIKINTNDDTVSFITLSNIPTNNANWGGCVYAPNGYIYAMPGRQNKILKINPSTDTISFITDGPTLDSTTVKYLTACLATNGCAYAVPCKGNKILKFDTATETYTLLEHYGFSNSGQGYFGCSKLGSDGCIYGFPRSGADVVKIDPSNDSVTNISAYSGTSNDWVRHEGVDIGIIEKIYGFPTNVSTNLIKISQSENSASVINTNLYGTDAVLAPNGCIYCPPRGNNRLFRLNTFDDAYTTIVTSYSDYTWSRLAPNGCIYALPARGGTKSILKININATSNFQESTLLSPFLNNY